jgi:hypothetical protein
VPRAAVLDLAEPQVGDAELEGSRRDDLGGHAAAERLQESEPLLVEPDRFLRMTEAHLLHREVETQGGSNRDRCVRRQGRELGAHFVGVRRPEEAVALRSLRLHLAQQGEHALVAGGRGGRRRRCGLGSALSAGVQGEAEEQGEETELRRHS